MRISVIVSDPMHPVFPYIQEWGKSLAGRHEFQLVQKRNQLNDGDILFMISCAEMIGPDVRKKFRYSLVIHASDLPKGRGWSPHIWGILEGQNSLTLSLFEAAEPVDSGDIWKKIKIPLEGHELFDEINEKLFAGELELMQWAVDNCDKVKPQRQDHSSATSYRRRKPEDSEIDVNKSIAEQFNQLRVSDPYRFPAFFEYNGSRYYIQISKKTFTKK